MEFLLFNSNWNVNSPQQRTKVPRLLQWPMIVWVGSLARLKHSFPKLPIVLDVKALSEERQQQGDNDRRYSNGKRESRNDKLANW